jgi:hypothetical protein
MEEGFAIQNMNNKKASVLDILVITVMVFALGLFIIVGYKVFSVINTEFQANPDLSDTSKSIVGDLKGKYVGLFDGIFFTFLIFFAIAILVGVYYLNLHPIFFIPSILVIIFTIIIGGVIANTYSDITDASDFQSEANEFILMPFIFDNYITFITVIGFLIVIVMYAKNRITE